MAKPEQAKPEQWFHFGPWVFSIKAAEELIAAAPRDVEHLDVSAWAAAHGLAHLDNPDSLTVGLLGPDPKFFDRAYAMTTDLSKPVIIARLAVGEKSPAPLLIDGTHRLYRAWRDGLIRLPAYVLTPGETSQIRRDARLGPGWTSFAAGAGDRS